MNTNGRRLWKHAAGWLTGIMVLSSACGTTAMANGVMLVETASVADVHAEADDTSPVLATLSGTQAKVLENSGRWMKVQGRVISPAGWKAEHLTDGSDTLDDIAPGKPGGNTESGRYGRADRTDTGFTDRRDPSRRHSCSGQNV